MSTVAACLKVQVGDSPIEIKSIVDDFYTFATDAPQNLSIEQITAYALLSEYFAGFNSWGFLVPPKPMPISNTFTKIGYAVDSNSVSNEGFIIPEIGDISPFITLAGLDDIGLKEAVKNIMGVPAPPNWPALVDATPASGLQDLVDQELDSSSQFQIHYEPITLKIHRCTQSEIDALFMGDYPPHVDMFETMKFMLTGHLDELDNRGLSPAYYDSINDVIVLKSKYYTTQVMGFVIEMT